MESPQLSNEDRIVAAIRQIIRAVDLHSKFLVNDYGMTGPQLAVLQELNRVGGSTPKRLACAVHLSQATVTGILKRLETRGMVKRQPSSADRRSVFIEISEAGRSVLASSPSLLQDRFRDSLSSLPPWEQTQILATLQRVATLMEADAIDAAPHLTPGEISEAS
jgi:DNA-binding MarR family transcriptional regulator